MDHGKNVGTSINSVVTLTSIIDKSKDLNVAILSKHCRCTHKQFSKHDDNCTANYTEQVVEWR